MRKLIVAAALAMCLVPALAFAADPAKNSAFQWCESRDRCPFGFETSKNGKYVKEIKAYNKCAQVPAVFPKIRVRNGAFSKSGTVTDVIGNKLDYAFKGRFTSRKKAVGTYDIDAKDCRAKPTKFVARRIGKARAGV